MKGSLRDWLVPFGSTFRQHFLKRNFQRRTSSEAIIFDGVVFCSKHRRNGMEPAEIQVSPARRHDKVRPLSPFCRRERIQLVFEVGATSGANLPPLPPHDLL